MLLECGVHMSQSMTTHRKDPNAPTQTQAGTVGQHSLDRLIALPPDESRHSLRARGPCTRLVCPCRSCSQSAAGQPGGLHLFAGADESALLGVDILLGVDLVLEVSHRPVILTAL